MFHAFLDELEKIAVSHGQLVVAKSRTGTRPISVANFLKKDNAGTLYKKKKAGVIDVAVGYDDPGAAKPKPKPGEGPTRDDKIAALDLQPVTGPAAHKDSRTPPTQKGDLNTIKREDGRDFATNITHTGGLSIGIGNTNHPAEHS